MRSRESLIASVRAAESCRRSARARARHSRPAVFTLSRLLSQNTSGAVALEILCAVLVASRGWGPLRGALRLRSGRPGRGSARRKAGPLRAGAGL